MTFTRRDFLVLLQSAQAKRAKLDKAGLPRHAKPAASAKSALPPKARKA